MRDDTQFFLINKGLYSFPWESTFHFGMHEWIIYGDLLSYRDVCFGYERWAVLQQLRSTPFTKDELVRILELDTLPMHPNAIHSVFKDDEILLEKYFCYANMFVHLEHDLHHIILSHADDELISWPTFIQETATALIQAKYLPSIESFANTKAYLGFQQTIIEEFCSDYLRKFRWTKETLVEIHENIALGSDEKVLWDVTDLLPAFKREIASESFVERKELIIEITNIAKEETKYMISCLENLTNKGNPDWAYEFAATYFSETGDDFHLPAQYIKTLGSWLKYISIDDWVGHQLNQLIELVMHFFYSMLTHKVFLADQELYHEIYSDYSNVYLPPLFEYWPQGFRLYQNMQDQIIQIVTFLHKNLISD